MRAFLMLLMSIILINNIAVADDKDQIIINKVIPIGDHWGPDSKISKEDQHAILPVLREVFKVCPNIYSVAEYQGYHDLSFGRGTGRIEFKIKGFGIWKKSYHLQINTNDQFYLSLVRLNKPGNYHKYFDGGDWFTMNIFINIDPDKKTDHGIVGIALDFNRFAQIFCGFPPTENVYSYYKFPLKPEEVKTRMPDAVSDPFKP